MKSSNRYKTLIMLAQIIAYAKADFEEDRNLDGCSVALSGSIFNLGKLTNHEQADYQVAYQLNKNVVSLGVNTGLTQSEQVLIQFNICEPTLQRCNNDQSNEPSFANIISTQTGQCKHLSSPILSEVNVNLLNEQEPKQGLILDYKGGDHCNNTHTYSLQIVLQCDEKYNNQPIYELQQTSYNESEECEPKVIVMKSSEACPKMDFGPLWKFSNQFNYLIAALMILYGLYNLAFGNHFQEVTLFLGGQIIAQIVFMFIMILAVPNSQNEMWKVWVYLIAGNILGSFAGYAIKRWARHGVIIIALWIGGLVGSIVYNTFIHIFEGDEKSIIVLILNIISFAILFGYMAHIYFHVSVIFGSAILGSFFFYRGIAIFAGGYPNEFLLLQRLNNPSGSVPLTFFIYLGAMAFTCLISIVFQIKAGRNGFYDALFSLFRKKQDDAPNQYLKSVQYNQVPQKDIDVDDSEKNKKKA